MHAKYMKSIKLNLGCGNDIKRGWVNLDIADLPGVDVVWDIEKLPLPFGDEQFDEILCNDILEHVEYVPILRELHRILKQEGKIKIRVPHFTSRTNFIDPTHKKQFSISTFEFFLKNSEFQKEYYFNFYFDRIGYAKIKFLKKGVFFFNRFVKHIVNVSHGTQCFYESSFLSRLFPADHIVIVLIK